MQLVRYLIGSEAEIGVLDGNRVIGTRNALRRLSQLDGRLGPFAHIFDYATTQPKVILGLGPLFSDALAEAVARDDGASVVTEQGLAALRVLPFVPDPEKVFGIGYNYRELCDHENHEHPPRPLVFAKMPTCVTAAYDDINVTPAVELVDFESELCVVIGRPARRVPAARALDHIGAYTVVNELSAKILPRPTVPGKTETLPQKAVDDFAPLGPTVITPDEIRDPSALHIVARVNGEQRQSFPTADMVHDVPALIEYISAIITLHPGDMIATGTSVGCGIVDRPPRLLNDGDVVDCEIVGYPGCRNTMRIPAQRAKKKKA
jgi:2-keto-4-pentenoate hydratase/2-oxohepta-3-ene-1,7-dioic acid hydratase in catechol pathway